MNVESGLVIKINRTLFVLPLGTCNIETTRDLEIGYHSTFVKILKKTLAIWKKISGIFDVYYHSSFVYELRVVVDGWMEMVCFFLEWMRIWFGVTVFLGV